MKGWLLFFACELCVRLVCAQDSPMIFGEIPLADLTMTKYVKDSSAEAVILNDFFKVSEKPGEGCILERHVRIKILKEQGFRWGDVKIPVYAYYPQLIIKAATHYIEEGKLISVTIPKESVVRQKIRKDLSFETFSFPQVRKGAVLEYQVNFKSLLYPGWQFQAPIPVRRCDFWAGMPNTGVLHNYVQGNFKPAEYSFTETALTKLYHWAYEDVPAFHTEPMISNEQDYIGGISFSYLRSWEQLNSDLVTNKFFFNQIAGNGFLKKITSQLTKDVSDPLKKVDTLYKYVQNRYTQIKADPDVINLKRTFDETTGSSMEINMLLASMIDKIGLQTYIVLLSTRANGKINKDFPIRSQFDYAVCAVVLGDKYIFLDASKKFLPLGFLPEQFVDGEGFIVSDKTAGWVSLNFLPNSKTTINASLKISEDGKLTGSVNFSREGYDGVEARNLFTDTDEWSFIKNCVKEETWDINQSSFENTRASDRPFKDTYQVSIKNENPESQFIYISPVVAGGMKTNPFTDTGRLYPISFPANRELIYLASLSIPEGYEVEELPKGIILKLQDSSAKFTYSATQTGNVIQILYSLKRQRSLYQPGEYWDLKEFYSHVTAKRNEKIVLKKK
ncbi:MAG TPA: DUF3857 domain-containing protein [Cyclobacteriaceae bacterium]|nr:DUF3857 domain-containing protein [Cyclobacteriaceae bacterium]HMV07861.1 DUF3857 domain-containing protein [Cyclobacteriaceae bacterium]HMV88129.1 DUF3857 domain-containing protein [Cyclobacteriaceae bacterium]HMW98995.1 DUF3857 domain-containing protein [Cyclobacteriaceae bacterium]HMX48371.1 DUF3857 domain-containing protein [Cyclobacteriaceae bacterium]